MWKRYMGPYGKPLAKVVTQAVTSWAVLESALLMSVPTAHRQKQTESERGLPFNTVDSEGAAAKADAEP